MLARAAKRVGSKTGRLLNVGAAGLRSLSSRSFLETEKRVAEIRMPIDIAEEFLGRVTGHCEAFKGDEYSLRPLTLKEAEAGFATLDHLVRQDRDLTKAFAEARKDETLVSIVEGISVPEMPKDKIPTEISDLSKQSFIKLIRPTEITAYAFNRMLGFEPNNSSSYYGNEIITSIFATSQEERSDSSYRSSEELKWHTDGWSLDGYNIDEVSLLGVVGKKGIQTEVILARDIVNNFRESGKEDLLKILAEESLIEGADEFFSIPTQIIDPEEETISYAQYGIFKPEKYSDISKFYEALIFLNESLATLPSLSLELDQGDLLKIDNRKTIHRKTNKNSKPGNEVDSAVGERLLLRQFGSKTPEAER